jgi:hypothetical protein
MDGLKKQLAAFDKLLNEALETPTKLKEKLPAIESAVALMTHGWRGSEKTSKARGVFKVTCKRMRDVFFIIDQLSEAIDQEDKAQKDLLLSLLDGAGQPRLKKQVEQALEQRSEGNGGAIIDKVLRRNWEAVKQQVFNDVHPAVKTGIENRIRQEMDEHGRLEDEKVRNPSYGLAQLMKAGGLPDE